MWKLENKSAMNVQAEVTELKAYEGGKKAEEVEANFSPAYVHYRQSLLSERVLFLDQIRQLKAWARLRREDLPSMEREMYK